MKTNNYLQIESKQISRRNGKTFLMKPAAEATSFMCTEFNLEQTFECPRVIRLQDYFYGIEELSENKLYRLLGNQPVLYLQERFACDGNGYEWNGFILYRTSEKQIARQMVKEHADELCIALAFDSPLDNRYYILVKTSALQPLPTSSSASSAHLTTMCYGYSTPAFVICSTANY